jgi:subtilisin family serine protease
VIQGILYAATPQSKGGAGADIINMSLGATFPRGGGNTGAGPLVAALNKAVNFAARSTLVISSAGNGATDFDHSGSLIKVPAQSGSGIAISATGPVGYAVGWPNGATNFRRPASYTDFGVSLVNLAAPGGDFVLPGTDVCSIPRVPSSSVTTACWVFDLVLSTARGAPASTTTYAFAAGTSMSAPAAAGVAALIKQRFPGISVGALKNKLAATADDEGAIGVDPFYGRGFVNARRAVTE